MRAVATAYTTIVRGVPDLVLMLLIYYGGQRLLNAALERWWDGAYLDPSAFTSGKPQFDYHIRDRLSRSS